MTTEELKEKYKPGYSFDFTQYETWYITGYVVIGGEEMVVVHKYNKVHNGFSASVEPFVIFDLIEQHKL